jgi:hypothetical protein
MKGKIIRWLIPDRVVDVELSRNFSCDTVIRVKLWKRTVAIFVKEAGGDSIERL